MWRFLCFSFNESGGEVTYNRETNSESWKKMIQYIGSLELDVFVLGTQESSTQDNTLVCRKKKSYFHERFLDLPNMTLLFTHSMPACIPLRTKNVRTSVFISNKRFEIQQKQQPQSPLISESNFASCDPSVTECSQSLALGNGNIRLTFAKREFEYGKSAQKSKIMVQLDCTRRNWLTPLRLCVVNSHLYFTGTEPKHGLLRRQLDFLQLVQDFKLPEKMKENIHTIVLGDLNFRNVPLFTIDDKGACKLPKTIDPKLSQKLVGLGPDSFAKKKENDEKLLQLFKGCGAQTYLLYKNKKKESLQNINELYQFVNSLSSSIVSIKTTLKTLSEGKALLQNDTKAILAGKIARINYKSPNLPTDEATLLSWVMFFKRLLPSVYLNTPTCRLLSTRTNEIDAKSNDQGLLLPASDYGFVEKGTSRMPSTCDQILSTMLPEWIKPVSVGDMRESDHLGLMALFVVPVKSQKTMKSGGGETFVRRLVNCKKLVHGSDTATKDTDKNRKESKTLFRRSARLVA